jgi:hypothetical protein
MLFNHIRLVTPPIVTSDFVYLRLIGDRSIDEKDFDAYRPTLQKMINSFQIQGAKENPDNMAFVPNVKNAPTADVVLLSQKLKKGGGDYNDIIGQVKMSSDSRVNLLSLRTIYCSGL